MTGDQGAEVILCDTSLVGFLAKRRKHPEQFEHWSAELVARLEKAILAVSVITLAEAEVGYRKSGWSPRKIEQERLRLQSLLLIPLDVAILTEWARLKHKSVDSGWNIGDNDLWIAATAAARSLPLATCDRDHGRIEDERVEILYLPPKADSAS